MSRAKNSRQESPKGDFKRAATGRFFLGEGADVHTQATIKPCRRPLRDIESHMRVKHCTLLEDFRNNKN